MTDERLYSTAEVAALLGVTPGRVRQLATERGVGRKVGAGWVFTPRDVDGLVVRQPGRPWPNKKFRKSDG